MTTIADEMSAAIEAGEAAVRHMMASAAAVGLAACGPLERSEGREEFLGHLDLAVAAFHNGEVAKRALAALGDCRALMARHGFGAQRRRRRIMEIIANAMAEVAAVIPVTTAVQ